MWKKLLRSVLFLTIFSLLFLAVSPIFVPKNNTSRAGIHEPNAKGFLAEPEDTIDVLFLGDSEAYSGFIPLRIWEQHGITSYVCSTGDQMMYQAYSYLDWVFRSQSPKVVVLETNALYRAFTLADMISHTAEELFPYLRYHDRWKSLQPEDWGSSPSHGSIVRDRGYLYFTKTVSADTAGYMAPSEEVHPVPYLNREYARLIRDFCRERSVDLVLVSTPSPTNWSIYYHNGVDQMARELEVPYIDMNLMPQEIPINWQTDSYDGGDHLNYFGACKVTSHLGTFLWNTGLFTDKRGLAEYSAWNTALDDFNASTAGGTAPQIRKTDDGQGIG